MVSTAIASSSKDLHELGDVPDLGVVPSKMLAQLIRPERFGEPIDAFKEEAFNIIYAPRFKRVLNEKFKRS